jgi:hypothetical protein
LFSHHTIASGLFSCENKTIFVTSGIFLFKRGYFSNLRLCGSLVLLLEDVDSPMEAAASSGNSKPPANLMILPKYGGADKPLARPGRKQATATEVFEFHISYL